MFSLLNEWLKDAERSEVLPKGKVLHLKTYVSQGYPKKQNQLCVCDKDRWGETGWFILRNWLIWLWRFDESRIWWRRLARLKKLPATGKLQLKSKGGQAGDPGRSWCRSSSLKSVCHQIPFSLEGSQSLFIKVFNWQKEAHSHCAG